MFKFKRNYNRILLIGVFVFNIIILISLIFYLFIQLNILPKSLFILTIPIELLSTNIFLVLFLLILEGLIIGLNLYKKRKEIKINNNSNKEVQFDFLIDDEDEMEIDADQQHLTSSNYASLINNEDIWEENSSALKIESSPQQIEGTIEAKEDENIVSLDEEDMSPGFLEINDKLVTTKLRVKSKIKKSKDTLTDQQFAIYQAIVSNEWFFENSNDRERIGFDKYAINESKISLSDINFLIKIGLVYKINISHPSGSFHVITTNPNIEYFIIETIIRRDCRKKRIKITKRKFDFQNWKEFGMIKRIWQFNLELPEFKTLITIFTNNEFEINNSDLKLKQEAKEKLKALIAASTLKLKDKGTALVITNSKEKKNLVNKFIKSTGWGKVNVLDFSSKDFIAKFSEFIK